MRPQQQSDGNRQSEPPSLRPWLESYEQRQKNNVYWSWLESETLNRLFTSLPDYEQIPLKERQE